MGASMGERSERFADLTLGGFAEALASDAPTPGGGSAAAVAASLAAALTVMVARLSIGRPRYAEHAALHEDAIRVGEELRQRFLDLADDDASVYAAFSRALKLPRASGEEQAARAAAIRSAARAAAEVPLATMRECHRLVSVTEGLVGRSNANAASDLDVAAMLLEAAAGAAAANVVVNLDAAGDAAFTEASISESGERLSSLRDAVGRIHEGVRSGHAASRVGG